MVRLVTIKGTVNKGLVRFFQKVFSYAATKSNACALHKRHQFIIHIIMTERATETCTQEVGPDHSGEGFIVRI